MLDVRKITRLSAVIALYVVLTVAIQPFAYGDIQFRISEVLVLLAFYRKDYSIALIIGCAIANILSPLGPIDIVVGTLATTIAVLGVAYSKNLIVASLFPVVVNGVIIGLLLNYVWELPLVASMIYVAIGEAVVVSVLGVILFKVLEKNRNFMQLIEANQNIEF